jgi:hypothetical protein
MHSDNLLPYNKACMLYQFVSNVKELLKVDICNLVIKFNRLQIFFGYFSFIYLHFDEPISK